MEPVKTTIFSITMVLKYKFNTEMEITSINNNEFCTVHVQFKSKTRMWANAQPDGRPAEHRCRPLFNAAKFG